MDEVIEDAVRRALAEDLGTGDVTTDATVPPGARATATISAKAPGVIAGTAPARAAFAQVDPALEVAVRRADGDRVEPGDVVLTARGSAAALLTAERTALNFLQRLSGVATLTSAFVAAVEGTGVTILDTRKTTPGLRLLEKAAVRAGGGANHRIGLYDAVLIKENHHAMAGGVGAAIRAAREQHPGLPIECEVRDLDELDEALDAGAPRVLLDNMTPAELAVAVARVAGRAETEASGGAALQSVKQWAVPGLDFISVGALTHSAPALDLSMLLEAHP